MKTKIIIFSLFGLLLFMGCKDEPRYSRFENHNVSACGIADPLNNSPWLKAYCVEYYNFYEVNISIYKNVLTNENHIVINTADQYVPSRSPSRICTKEVYTCEGVMILFQGTEGPTPDGWDAFFQENTLVAKIWSVQEIIKD